MAERHCNECGEHLSTERFDGSCDRCLHFREPLYQIDWYDGPLYACADCLTETERRTLHELPVHIAGGPE